VVFVDESGYFLRPLRRRVWSIEGHTPIHHVWDRRDRITSIAAITRAPWADRLGLYYTLLDHNARTPDFIRFLRDVHSHLQRPMILVWDRLRAHRSAARQLHEHQATWLTVEWLPAYAPDLNPVEGIWAESKYGDLANYIPADINDLREVLDDVLEEYRHDPCRIHSFFTIADLAT
jgi:transposase